MIRRTMLALAVAALVAWSVPALADQLPSAPRDAGVGIAAASVHPRDSGAPGPLTDDERERLCGG